MCTRSSIYLDLTYVYQVVQPLCVDMYKKLDLPRFGLCTSSGAATVVHVALLASPKSGKVKRGASSQHICFTIVFEGSARARGRLLEIPLFFEVRPHVPLEHSRSTLPVDFG